MENQEKICRFCVTKCADNFKCIKEVTKDMLDTLLVKINLGISDEPVLCTNCSDIIQRCFAFKSLCLSTENCIVPFVNDKDRSKLNLKEIYRIIKNEQIEILDNHSICRLCIHLIENEQKVVISERIMLEKCLPELDLTVTENLLICSVCHDHLQIYYNFIMNCSKVEKKINKYYESTVINRQDLIQLKDVIQFTTKNVCEEGDTENKSKKGEENRVEIKQEQFIEMEDQKFNGTLQYSPKPMFGNEEDDFKVDIYKIERFCGEEKIKIKQEEETFVEIKSQPFLSCGEDDMKINDHNFNRLQDNVVLSGSEGGIMLSKKQRSLLPVTSRNSNRQYRLCSNQPKCKTHLQKRKRISRNPSKIVFKCEFCPYRTYLQGNFRRHMLIHESSSEITMFKCNFCSYQAKRKDVLRRHMLIHKNPSEITKFKCEFCSYKAKHKRYLATHLLTHKSSSEITMFECESCSYQTRYKAHLKTHILTHKNPSEISMFQCVHCSFQTKYKFSLRIHTQRIHKECTLEATLSNKNTEITMFKCESCSYQTRYKAHLNTHILIHKNPSETTAYKCESCSYQTKCRAYLQKHMLIHKNPSEITMFKCDVCSYQAKRKDVLQSHMLIHRSPTEVAIYQCESCSYMTKHKRNLQQHLLIHRSSSEITMFKCEFCSYQTKRKRDLHRHMLIHRSTSEVTMFKCESCSHQTKRKRDLQRHMRVHRRSPEITIFKCDSCSYQTKRKRDLQIHMIIHERSSEITTIKCESSAHEIAVVKCEPY